MGYHKFWGLFSKMGTEEVSGNLGCWIGDGQPGLNEGEEERVHRSELRRETAAAMDGGEQSH